MSRRYKKGRLRVRDTVYEIHPDGRVYEVKFSMGRGGVRNRLVKVRDPHLAAAVRKRWLELKEEEREEKRRRGLRLPSYAEIDIPGIVKTVPKREPEEARGGEEEDAG